MALYWPEAALAVACTGTEEAQEWPGNVLVISMRPEQADDPEFVETVRDLVVDRIFEHRRMLVKDLLASGSTVPEPRGGTHDGDGASEAERAEALLRRNVMEDAPGTCDDTWDPAEHAYGERGPWAGGDLGDHGWLGYGDVYGPYPGVAPDPAHSPLVVNHCDQLVIHA